MAKKPQSNRDRLNSATRTLQLLQRTNPPTSSMAKTATKALDLLLKELASLPAPAPELPARAPDTRPPDTRVQQAMGDATGVDDQPS